MTDFASGIELSRHYWHEIVAPIVDDVLARTPRAAALLGTGSDVLGFDTERSTDHGWGPRVVVFLDDDNALDAARRREVAAAIDARIPETFLGYATRFAARTGGPVRHQVTFATVSGWFTALVGFDPRGDITTADWLAAPSQLLRTCTAGAVFEDSPGHLTAARDRLRWYPDDVWLYLLACQWRRIDQEEPFVGRTGEVGDELGSAVIAARLVRDVMRLCFLIERQYAPYAKWLGTAFARLQCAPALTPYLESTLRAAHWKQREAALIPAMEQVAQAFNALGITEAQDPVVRYFYDRPFQVLASERFVEACMAKTALASLGYTGGIDQFADSTDVLSDAAMAQRLRRFIALVDGG